MRSITKKRLATLVGTLAAAVVVSLAASGATGAYFSDTKSGAITGTTGSLKVATSGGTGADGLNFVFDNLMPGEPQTVTANYQNVGTGPQDVYLTFPDVAALHALNNMGTFGEVTVTDSSAGLLFHSVNLNDNRPDASGTCGTFSETGCWPLPVQLLIRSGLPKNATGSVSFTFSYPAKKTGGQGLAWNIYPSPGAQASDALTAGSGLPFKVVAVQVGRTP
jgi:hypothetical protein